MRLLTVVTLWLLARCSSPKDVDCDELGMQQVVSCGHEPVRLHCISQHHQMTAVTEAWFYETAHVCTERPPPPPQPPSTADTAVPRYSLLDSFNARCSGRRHCTFRLREDHPNVWRPGVIFVRYRCIGREDVTRYCSEVVTAPHGYLTNPGYPRYYPGQVNCTWHLRAHPGQHLRLRVHDLDVRGVPQGSDTCTDYLRVSEGRRVLSLACGVLREPLVVSSRGPELTVTLWGHGQPLLPHRGALIHFTAVGCPTPSPPRDGYLVFRNATHVLFSCCVNFVFGDTLQKERLLRCQDGRGWSLSLPAQCIEVRLLMEYANDTVRRELEHQLVTPPPTGAPRPVHTRTHTLFVDTILPILILVGLMLGNCVIVAVIMKYRRRDRDHRERGRGAAGRTARELVDLSDPDPRTV